MASYTGVMLKHTRLNILIWMALTEVPQFSVKVVIILVWLWMRPIYIILTGHKGKISMLLLVVVNFTGNNLETKIYKTTFGVVNNI